MATMERDTASLRQTNSSLQLQVESFRSEIATLTNEIEELDFVLAADSRQQEVDSLRRKNAGLEAKVQALTQELRTLTEELEQTEAEAAAATGIAEY